MAEAKSSSSSKSSKQTVPVTIQGREYRIRAETTPEAVKAAAELLNETIDRVRKRAGTVDSLDVVVLAALNIANTLVAERESGVPSSVLGPRLADLVTLVESALADPPTTH